MGQIQIIKTRGEKMLVVNNNRLNNYLQSKGARPRYEDEEVSEYRYNQQIQELLDCYTLKNIMRNKL